MKVEEEGRKVEAIPKLRAAIDGWLCGILDEVAVKWSEVKDSVGRQ